VLTLCGSRSRQEEPNSSGPAPGQGLCKSGPAGTCCTKSEGVINMLQYACMLFAVGAAVAVTRGRLDKCCNFTRALLGVLGPYKGTQGLLGIGQR